MYTCEWYDHRDQRQVFRTDDKWTFIRWMAERDAGAMCRVQILVEPEAVTLTFRFPEPDDPLGYEGSHEEAVDMACEEVEHECHGFGLRERCEARSFASDASTGEDVYTRVFQRLT